MKYTLFLLFFFSKVSYSQIISEDSLSLYLNKNVKVCSKFEGGITTRGDKKVVLLNFGDKFPNQKFTVVIYENDLKNFKYNPINYLKNKTVCIKGVVSIYKEKFQIVAKNEEQFEVVQ
jgi:hypothetical protein